MKKNKIIYSILFLCIVSVMLLTGCSDNNNNSNENNKEKVIQELDYLDTKLVGVLNKLNNISLQNYSLTSEEVSLKEEGTGEKSESGGSSSSGQGGASGGGSNESNSESKTVSSNENTSNVTTTQMEPKTILDTDENDIDWKTIKSDIEIINDAWGVVLIDLSNFNIDNGDILGFSSALDDSILSIKDENKIDSLSNVSKLYAYIPKYESAIAASNSIQNVKQVKSYLINAYSLVEQDKWDEVQTNISDAEKTFKNIANDVEYIKDKEYKVNRTYVLIKELQNSLQYKDKKLFYVKYKNLMESINTL